jgi:APA family basic amino acid/polyamine antiporter
MKKLFDEAASISLVMGNIIGSGIFFIPIALAKFGYTSLIGFLIATFGALSIAAVLTHLNKYIRKTGGPYLYVKEALGEAMGFNVACSYFIAWCIGNATMILALPKFIAFFIPTFD